MCFTGFPKEFIEFLHSLQYNNTDQLLSENKIKYKALITEPLVRLYNGKNKEGCNRKQPTFYA